MLFPPEAFRNVFGMAVAVTVETLIGGAGAQPPEFFLITADFYIVEQISVEWQCVVARIPCHFKM